MNPPSQLLLLARKAATAQSLDPGLVCAVVEQESGWNSWAMRYEPLFFSKYVASLYTNNKIAATEAYARGFSWGLMQVMGQVAREAGFDPLFLSAMCDPAQEIRRHGRRYHARAARLERRRQSRLRRASPRSPLALFVGPQHCCAPTGKVVAIHLCPHAIGFVSLNLRLRFCSP